MSPAADPVGLIDTLAPGVVLQRAILDAVAAASIAHGGTLTQAQVIAITGPLPAPLTSIRRLPERGGV